MTAEQAILAAFPGTDPETVRVRKALLDVVHFHRHASASLDSIDSYLRFLLDDPPFGIWYGPDAALVSRAANELHDLANALSKSVAALNAAQPHWQRFDDSRTEGASHVDDGRLRAAGDSECPF